MKSKLKKTALFATLTCFAIIYSCSKNNSNQTALPAGGTTPSSLKIISTSVSPLSASYVNTSTEQSTGFEDGTINPFTICTTLSPNYGKAFTKNGNKCIKFYWEQSSYDGTRDTKGAEACSSLNFYKEGWYGFHIYLPSTGFPTNKNLTVAQIFELGGCSSWTAMLEVRNNDLWIEHRGNCSTPAQYLVKIASNIQKDAWKSVIIHFVASNANAGMLQIWYDGASQSTPTYSQASINLGFGTWATGDVLATGSAINLKFGMYNWDTANYTSGETRALYYDNVTQLVGNPSGAWSTVNPGVQ